MTQETFDPITRNIRAIETEARVVIASAETAIASMRRKRNPTVAAYQSVFNKLGECLQATNAAHDLVVAHAHLVADNIASRSRNNVLTVRDSLLETANQMLSHVQPSVMQGVYDPSRAFASITTALDKKGLLEKPPAVQSMALSRTAVGYIITYQLERYMISVVVIVETTSEGKNLGEGSDKISVSVWEDRVPQIWDRSYHDANSKDIASSDSPVGKKDLGRWTRQTDAALVDYVATVLSRDVVIPNEGRPADVPPTYKQNTNRYGTQIGHAGKAGSAKFDFAKQRDILKAAIINRGTGPQGQYTIDLDPRAVNKAHLARYILDIIKEMARGSDLNEGSVRLHRDGYYQILFDSEKKVSSILREVLGDIGE